MELYDHTTRGKFPLSSLKEETPRGVGITGTNNASRATLGLKALYADVSTTAGLKRARATPRPASPPVDGDTGNGNDNGNGNGNASLSNGAVPGGEGGGGRGSAADQPNEERGGGGGSGDGQEGARLLTTPTTTTTTTTSSSSAGLSLATMPLLGHRYRCVSTIGTGAFSDVFRAEDTFRPGRSVAIKVMNLGCGAIGIREVRYMRFLGSLPKSEFSPVVKLLDALVFRGHQCLVMELFDDTLLPYTLRPAGGGGAETGSAAAAAGYGRLGFLAGSLLLGKRVGADRRVRRRRGVAEGGRAPSERGQGWGRGVAGPPSPSRPPPPPPPLSCANGGGGAESDGSAGGCPTHVVRHVAVQLLSALVLLHDHGVIHADVKPQNVLLGARVEEGVGAGGGGGGGADRPLQVENFMCGGAGRGRDGVEWLPPRVTVKLCDFGSAIHKSEACLYYGDFEIQALAYRAPEVLMGCPFGPPIDTWSAGVILLELLLGRPLFHTAGSRAALLAQMVCAFGPLPLRRFRVGRFYSEYFAHDQSMKVGGTSSTRPRDDDVPMGCCSCCWVEDACPGGGTGGHPGLSVSRCRGCCAEKCRAPDRRRQSLGGASTQAVGGRRATPFPAAGRQTAAFWGSAEARSGASLQCPSWGIAHAHLFRLVTAANGVPLVDQSAPLAPVPVPASGLALTPVVRACAHVGRGDGDGGSGSGGGDGVARPRACRFGSGSSSTAKRNPRLLSLLAGLLCLNPDERLTPLQALAHPFFDEVFPFALPTATAEINMKVKAEPIQAAPALPENPCALSLSARASPAEEMMGPRHGGGKQGRPLGDTFWGTALEGTPALAQPVAAAATAATTVTRISKQSEPFSDSFNGGVDAEPRAHERKVAPTPPGLNRGRSKVTHAALGVFSSQTRSAMQSRPEGAAACRIAKPVVEKPTIPSSSAWGSESGELDPTAQLRRLAETAEEMVGKGNRSRRGAGESGSVTSSGSGSGSGTNSGSGSGLSGVTLPPAPAPPPPPTPRRNRFMDVLPRTAPELAGSRGGAKPATDLPTLFTTPTEQQQQPQPNAISRAPPASTRAPGHAGGTAHASGAAMISGRRRRNRFLTAATLAKLDHDLTERGARAAGAGERVTARAGAEAASAAAAVEAASCWAARTKPESTPAKHPRKRPLLDASPGGGSPGTTRKVAKTAKTVAAVAAAATTREVLPEEFPLFEPHRNSPGSEESTTSLNTPQEAGGCTYAAVNRGGWASVRRRAAGVGRNTPPRKAAVAAGVALLRLRREASDSDSSLTL